MIEFFVQITVVVLWMAVLSIHTRRLLRLASSAATHGWGERRLRHRLERVWWWLGREEFWRAVHIDGMRCTQMTLMVFLFAWGVYV